MVITIICKWLPQIHFSTIFLGLFQPNNFYSVAWVPEEFVSEVDYSEAKRLREKKNK